MRRGGELRIVAHRSVGGRVLHDGAELAACEFVFVVFIDDQFDSERFAARQQHVERLREDVAIDEELVAALLDGFARTQRKHHSHRFGGGGALVEQRAVADLHARERDHGGLEIQQRFEATLRDLGLIGGVGGVPRGVLEDVARNGGRHGRRVIAHADERAQGAVAVGQFADVGGEFVFAHPLGGQRQRFFETDGLRNDLCDELVGRFHAEHVEHGFEVFFVVDADMAFGKLVEHTNMEELSYDILAFGDFICTNVRQTERTCKKIRRNFFRRKKMRGFPSAGQQRKLLHRSGPGINTT